MDGLALTAHQSAGRLCIIVSAGKILAPQCRYTEIVYIRMIFFFSHVTHFSQYFCHFEVLFAAFDASNVTLCSGGVQQAYSGCKIK